MICAYCSKPLTRCQAQTRASCDRRSKMRGVPPPPGPYCSASCSQRARRPMLPRAERVFVKMPTDLDAELAGPCVLCQVRDGGRRYQARRGRCPCCGSAGCLPEPGTAAEAVCASCIEEADLSRGYALEDAADEIEAGKHHG
jgi:hypothetical protein